MELSKQSDVRQIQKEQFLQAIAQTGLRAEKRLSKCRQLNYIWAVDPAARHAGLKLHCEDQRLSFPAMGQEVPVTRV
eukprot:11157312-Lingulodinium_polyedra.AAC.1